MSEFLIAKLIPVFDLFNRNLFTHSVSCQMTVYPVFDPRSLVRTAMSVLLERICEILGGLLHLKVYPLFAN